MNNKNWRALFVKKITISLRMPLWTTIKEIAGDGLDELSKKRAEMEKASTGDEEVSGEEV